MDPERMQEAVETDAAARETHCVPYPDEPSESALVLR
jgi:hypothetical protein